MRSIVTAGLLLLQLASPEAAAQTPCPAAPVFSVTATDPVLLTISHSTTRDLGGPRVEIAGTLITVTQIDHDLPPPPGTPGAGPCNTVTVSLGTLPRGMYTVTWRYAIPPAFPGGPFGPLESFTFAFAHGADSVPALGGPALFGLLLVLATLGVLLLRR